MPRPAFKLALVLSGIAAIAVGATALSAKKAGTSVSVASPLPAAPEGAVWIARPDGAESCSTKGAQTLEEGAAELRGKKVRVLDSRKDNDGKMRAAMCGLPQGSLNAYLIPRSEMAQAIAMGFVELKLDKKE